MRKREGGEKAGEICGGAPVVYYDDALFVINCLWAPPPVFETTFLPTKKKKKKNKNRNRRRKKKGRKKKLMKLNLNHSRGVNFNIVVFSTDSHFQGCSNVIICILKYIESSSSESYHFFRHGKHISHTGIFEVIKLINMFAVWEVRGLDITQLIYIIERSKRSSLPGIIALQ